MFSQGSHPEEVELDRIHDQLGQKVADIERKIPTIIAETKTIEVRVKGLQGERKDKLAAIKKLEGEVKKLDSKLDDEGMQQRDLEDEITSLKGVLAKYQDMLGALARNDD